MFDFEFLNCLRIDAFKLSEKKIEEYRNRIKQQVKIIEMMKYRKNKDIAEIFSVGQYILFMCIALEKKRIVRKKM